jgi:hypothetical protein
MVRNPSWSVGELIITDRIRNHRRIAQPFLKMMVVVPAAIVANRYVTSVAMGNKTYTLANTVPGDGLAHNVTCLQTAVDVEDTNGILTITGKDVNGKVITEDIIPDAGVTVQGNKAFKEITSIVGSGWAQGGTGPDTIVIGFGEKVGLPELIAAAGDVLLVGFDTVLVNAPTIAVASTVDGCTVTVPTGDGTKKLRVIYQIHQFNKDR